MDKSKDLCKTLFETFNQNGKDLNDDEKKVGVILFMQQALLTTGLDMVTIMRGGKFTEILTAIELGGKVNDKMTGVDIETKEGNIELKSSFAKPGNKVNVSIKPSVKSKNITVEEYNARFRKETLNKGIFRIEHQYGDSLEEKNIYVFDPQFIADLVLYKNGQPDKSGHIKRDKPVNIGGDCCAKCLKVHRLVEYKKLETKYLENPQNFDYKQLDSVVSSICSEILKKS